MTLFDDSSICARLREIARAVTSDINLHDDLVQEALLHLWGQEQLHPGQSLSWYFQSCHYCLLNFLRRGRSVDAIKRSGMGVEIYEAVADEEFEFEEFMQTQDDLLPRLSVSDIVEQLSPRLNTFQQSVLLCLTEG